MLFANIACNDSQSNFEDLDSEYPFKNGIYYQENILENFNSDKDTLYFWASIEINDSYLIATSYLCSKIIETEYYYIIENNVIPESFSKNDTFKFLADTVKSVKLINEYDSLRLDIVYADDFKLNDSFVFSIQKICIEKLGEDICEFEITYC